MKFEAICLLRQGSFDHFVAERIFIHLIFFSFFLHYTTVLCFATDIDFASKKLCKRKLKTEQHKNWKYKKQTMLNIIILIYFFPTRANCYFALVFSWCFIYMTVQTYSMSSIFYFFISIFIFSFQKLKFCRCCCYFYLQVYYEFILFFRWNFILRKSLLT